MYIATRKYVVINPHTYDGTKIDTREQANSSESSIKEIVPVRLQPMKVRGKVVLGGEAAMDLGG